MLNGLLKADTGSIRLDGQELTRLPVHRRLRGQVGMIIVEHRAETVLPIVDRTYVLVNGQVSYEAGALEPAAATQQRLLGWIEAEPVG